MLKSNPADDKKTAVALLTHGPKAVDPKKLEAAFAMGLNLPTIFNLIALFISDLPLLFTVIGAVETFIKQPGGITEANIQSLITTYGPQAEAMVTAILAALNLPLPTGHKPIPA